MGGHGFGSGSAVSVPAVGKTIPPAENSSAAPSAPAAAFTLACTDDPAGNRSNVPAPIWTSPRAAAARLASHSMPQSPLTRAAAPAMIPPFAIP